MTEVIHLSANYQTPALEFVCPFKVKGCRFRRNYGTPTGLRQGLTEHLLHYHNVQAIFDVAQTSLSEFSDRLRRGDRSEA